MNRTGDLTHGSIPRQVLLFSLPLIASNLLQVLFNISDLAVIGQFAGSNPLGSVGSTTKLVALFTGFLIGMGSGINVLTARYLGAHDDEDTHDTVHTALVICLIMGLFLMAIGLCCAHWMLALLNTKAELIDGAILYLRVYFTGMPACAVFNFGNAVFSACGNTRRPLKYLTIAGVLNIILNLFFVIVCKMDVAGVALASSISQYVSAILVLRALCRIDNPCRVNLRHVRLYPHKTRFLLQLGLPAGFQSSIFTIANLFIQTGINSFDATMVSADAAAANADTIIYDVMNAFYVACSSFIGQNYGAGNRERVLKSYRFCMFYAFAIGTILGVSSWVFAVPFLHLFTSDAAVIAAGVRRTAVMGPIYGISSFMDTPIAASRGLGDTLVPTIIVILGSCVFRIIWLYTVFAYFKTYESLYLLYTFSWAITAVAELLYFRRCRKHTVLPNEK